MKLKFVLMPLTTVSLIFVFFSERTNGSLTILTFWLPVIHFTATFNVCIRSNIIPQNRLHPLVTAICTASILSALEREDSHNPSSLTLIVDISLRSLLKRRKCCLKRVSFFAIHFKTKKNKYWISHWSTLQSMSSRQSWSSVDKWSSMWDLQSILESIRFESKRLSLFLTSVNAYRL